MSAHRFLIAALLALLLMCGLVMGQHDLPIPVNHAATGTAIGVNPDGNSFNVYLFNAKDQPSDPLGPHVIKRAYLHSSTVSAGMTPDWMHWEGGQWLFPFAYPSVITRGGMYSQEPGRWTEVVASVHRPERYAGNHSGTNWYWQNRTPDWATEPITCATTGRWEEGASWNVVVGLDRIGDETASHYFERSPNGGLNWVAVPNNHEGYVLPLHLAMTDMAVEDTTLPDKLVSVATSELDPVQNGELPLITGHVVSTKVCWTHNLRDESPRWYSFDPAPDEELWNLQIAMKNHVVYGLAYDSSEGSQVVFRASFSDTLGGWEPVEMNPARPLPAAIPYDLEMVTMHSLLTTSSAGLYYSPDDGVSWYEAADFATDVIRTPELRRMSIQKVDGGPPKIALAGWYASYVGTFDTTSWEFDLQEITYDPTVLNLYQNRNQAWGGLSLVEDEEYVDFALIDYSTDPYYANDSAVVVQVDGRNLPPKNVFLGYQDHGTRPFMRMTAGTGRPWVVYDKLGIDGMNGVVCRTATGAEDHYLTWDSAYIFSDPEGAVHGVVDAASCLQGDFVITKEDGVGANRLWQRRPGESEWVELTDEAYDLIAPTSDYRLYMALRGPTVNNHLAVSTDNGENWTDISPDPMHGDWSSISVGFDASMPLYGGTAQGEEPYGWIYRYDPNDHDLWGSPECQVVKVVADPYAGDRAWLIGYKPDSYVCLDMVVYVEGHYLDWSQIWVGEYPGEFDIMDLQVYSYDTVLYTVDVTCRPPDTNAAGVDHTIIKRFEFHAWEGENARIQALTADAPWLLNGEVIIPSGQTVTVEPGAEIQLAPGARLTVEGSLNAIGEAGNPIVFRRMGIDQRTAWAGINVSGSAAFSHCIIEGAVTGLKSVKAESLTVTNCTFQNNETGLDFYLPPGASVPEVTNCVVSNNQKNGIVLTGTASAAITQCQINHNGEDGVLLINSYVKLHENQILENGGYGLECLGSSPVLSCNNFQNNGAGEMGLFNESYPVLWDEDQGVGANSFMNDVQTLIIMESSAPIVVKGWNDFYVGPTGYFMADLSEQPVVHELSDNFWSPAIELGLFYPPDAEVSTWDGVAESSSNCGTPKGELPGLAGSLFEDGFAAEMSGDVALAQTKYTQLLTQYPDSGWSVPAAARLFETQRHLDSAYTTLQAFYNNLASSHPEDTLLADAVRALATRVWVEDRQYDPALSAYQQVIQNPPSSIDSVYAALDYSVTALRAQIEDSGGNLDSYVPSVSATSISHLVGLVRTALPTVPPTLHEGYSLPPSNFVLAQNYPNPFNAVTTIRYYVPEASRVALEVYNITGQHVATLKDAVESGGYHVVHWNASAFSSGVYICQLKAGSFVHAKKMMLIR